MFEFDTENLREYFRTRLSGAGLDSLKNDIRWSLNGSQGDGVAFYGPINLFQLLCANPGKFPQTFALFELDPDAEVYSCKKKHLHLYDHCNTMCADARSDKATPTLLYKVEDEVQNYLQLMSHTLEKEGNHCIEREMGAYEEIRKEAMRAADETLSDNDNVIVDGGSGFEFKEYLGSTWVRGWIRVTNLSRRGVRNDE